MIKADQIPDEVVEAAARAAWKLKDQRLWEILKATQPNWQDEARASIAAALNAWPGVEVVKWYHADQSLILPLPQGAAAPLEPRDE
jgi:hypothetical protein